MLCLTRSALVNVDHELKARIDDPEDFKAGRLMFARLDQLHAEVKCRTVGRRKDFLKLLLSGAPLRSKTPTKLRYRTGLYFSTVTVIESDCCALSSERTWTMLRPAFTSDGIWATICVGEDEMIGSGTSLKVTQLPPSTVGSGT